MFIRRTQTRSARSGEAYFTFRLVRSERIGPKVRQRTLLNLGRHFAIGQSAWPMLCRRIDEVLSGQLQLDPDCPPALEAHAQRIAAQLLARERTGTPAPAHQHDIQRVDVDSLELVRPRTVGVEHVGLWAMDQLGLRTLFHELGLGASLRAAAIGSIIARMARPGSERATRRWLGERSALGELLEVDFETMGPMQLYRASDALMTHRETIERHLFDRAMGLFDLHPTVTLYDLTNTYFESDPPFEDKRQFGYSRDKRSDCVQVVIALVVTPDGFPLAYEVMAGNTSDKTTLAGFLGKIEEQYGRSDRVWIMDRGIPTEATLAAMREGDAPVHYLVGTPKGRLTKLEKSFLARPWQAVRPSVEVKLLAEEGELYILVHSAQRVLKERSMRRRRLKKLWQRLHELRHQSNRRDPLLLKLGAAKKEAGRAWHLVDIHVPETGESLTAQPFTFALRRDRLRQAYRREGRYLLRSNMTGEDPATLWKYYMRLTEIEQAFKELEHDLAIRPIFHQHEERIEAHIFVSFLAYCLLVTVKHLARPHAPGLTARAIVEKFATLQMVDVHLPTTDGRRVVLPRHTQPNQDHKLLLHQLGLRLPEQPAPRISV